MNNLKNTYNIKLNLIFFFNLILNSFFFNELFLCISLLFIRYILDVTLFYHNFVKFEAPFYDTGTLMSLLICLEHLFVSYYLIIIIILVYWCLYIFIIDFLNWSPLNYTYSLKYVFSFFVNYFLKHWITFIFLIYTLIFDFFIFFKAYEFLWFLYLTHINFGKDKSIPKRFIGLFPFHFKKYFLNRINIINVLTNFCLHFDIIGRSFLILNTGSLKRILIVSLWTESIYTLWCDDVFINFYNDFLLNKKMFYFLFNNKPKAYFFFSSTYNLIHNKKANENQLVYDNLFAFIRCYYNDILNLNKFRHSGLFEAVWASFPSFIIISILIPSLILLYSFEDILNPKLTIKVIGNQWYWTYEFDNWVNLPNEVISFNDIDNINIIDYNYISFAFNSVILSTDLLESGSKRLLEVDNRLILPTNMTIRFLVTSIDVLHSFAVPELGFKVDAIPGRLNQILIYINRPGIYYGQCSELCGTNHGFMPIVIQAVSPDYFISYITKIKNFI